MLIIVESPAKARTISQIINRIKNFKDVIVKASKGHIRVISNNSKTSDGRKLEISGIDIEESFSPIYEADSSKKEVISELKKYAKSADQIMFATDEDREGEAISWHLSEVLGVKDKSKIKRMVFHEITESAIKEAIENPRNLDLYLVSAQKARQVLDKLVGFKLSPVLWSVLGNYNLSAGRVQSPALRLICEREKEIQNFQSKEYWEIQGRFNQIYDVKNKSVGNSLNSQNQSKDMKKIQDLIEVFSIEKLKNSLT